MHFCVYIMSFFLAGVQQLYTILPCSQQNVPRSQQSAGVLGSVVLLVGGTGGTTRGQQMVFLTV